jgi:hypothetical protein
MTETSFKDAPGKLNGSTAYPAEPSVSPKEKRWYDPRGWSPRTKLLAGAGSASLVIVGVVIGAVLGVKREKANAYPDYAPLKYSLADTYAGTSFFDNFRYFTDDDPTKGFVK